MGTGTARVCQSRRSTTSRRSVGPRPTVARVVVVHGHAMVGHAMQAALGRIPDVEVVGVAHRVDTAVVLVGEHQADVIVLDAALPGNDVADAVTRLRSSAHDARVVVIDSIGDYRSVAGAIQNGAAGYLLVHQPIDDLVHAIRAVCAGQTVVAPSLVPALLARLDVPARRGPMLSQREIDVLQLLAEGLSTAEVAKRLGISINTGRNNIQTVLIRLGAHSKLEAVSIGLREGLVAPPRPAA
jgi:DNA-binding NarL/FixJ family response regulator